MLCELRRCFTELIAEVMLCQLLHTDMPDLGRQQLLTVQQEMALLGGRCMFERDVSLDWAWLGDEDSDQNWFELLTEQLVDSADIGVESVQTESGVVWYAVERQNQTDIEPVEHHIDPQLQFDVLCPESVDGISSIDSAPIRTFSWQNNAPLPRSLVRLTACSADVATPTAGASVEFSDVAGQLSRSKGAVYFWLIFEPCFDTRSMHCSLYVPSLDLADRSSERNDEWSNLESERILAATSDRILALAEDGLQRSMERVVRHEWLVRLYNEGRCQPALSLLMSRNSPGLLGQPPAPNRPASNRTTTATRESSRIESSGSSTASPPESLATLSTAQTVGTNPASFDARTLCPVVKTIKVAMHKSCHHSYGLHSYGLYSYGLYSYGLYSYGLYSYGLYSYGL